MKLIFFPSEINPYQPKYPHSRWLPYLNGSVLILMITLLALLLQDSELVNIALLYQLPVILSAFWWGRWPSYFTAILSMLVFDFLFIPPTFTLSVDDMRYIGSFIIFLLVAFIIGGRTEALINEAATASQRERSTAALYQFSREIAAVSDLNAIIHKLALQVANTLGQRTRVILPDESGRLLIRADHSPATIISADPATALELLPDNEYAVARWSYKNRKPAGRASTHFSEAKYLYLPMTARDLTVGLLAVRVESAVIAPEQQQLLEAWAGLAAVAIERIRLMEKQQWII